jgi:catechol 2,3-dioxygenase-like lactoylglutathione lyase family enzyme
VPATALGRIRSLDYSIIYARDMAAMRAFYEGVMGFPLERTLGDNWIEFRIGSNILALADPGVTVAAKDAPLPEGSAALQLAFRVSPGDVDACATELAERGVSIVSPPTDQAWGHRTLFFRDPDGNVLEIYADI